MFGNVETAAGDRDLVQRLFAPSPFELLELCLYGILVTAIVDIGEFEEDQAKNRRAIFGGLEVRVGTEVVGCRPEIVFELF